MPSAQAFCALVQLHSSGDKQRYAALQMLRLAAAAMVRHAQAHARCHTARAANTRAHTHITQRKGVKRGACMYVCHRLICTMALPPTDFVLL